MRTKTNPFTAVVALLAIAATPVGAAVTSFLDQDLSIPTDYAGISLDLETGSTSISLEGLPGGDLNFVFGGQGFSNDADQNAIAPSWQPVRLGTANTDALDNLRLGMEVGPGSTFATGFGGSTENFTSFTPGEKGYLGFSVVLDDGNDTLAYGWVEVTFQNNDTPGVIHSWAFDDTGAPLAVGAVPEPTQSVLLMMGLLATVVRRRRA